MSRIITIIISDIYSQGDNFCSYCRGNAVAAIVFLLGIASLLPWNFMITANDVSDESALFTLEIMRKRFKLMCIHRTSHKDSLFGILKKFRMKSCGHVAVLDVQVPQRQLQYNNVR